MRKRTARLLELVIALLALYPVSVFAQGEAAGTDAPISSHQAKATTPHAADAASGPSASNQESALQLITFVLQLTDSQQRQIREKFNQAAEAAAPIVQQMQQNKNTILKAVSAGKSEKDIRELAENQGALTSRMLELQAHTVSELWQVLDSSQKARVDDFVFSNIRLFLPACPE